jgi:hypothetical protein
MLDRRKMKRELNRLDKSWKKTRRTGSEIYVIDCNNHPCRVTYFAWSPQDPWGASVDTVSLIDGRINGCSYFHCGIEPISGERAISMRDYAWERGIRDYMIYCIGYTEESLVEFEAMGIRL